VRGLASYISDYTIGWVANKVVMDLRNAMFSNLVRLPTNYYDNHTGGSLISKFTFDVLQVTGAATSVISVLFRDSLTIAGLLGWLFWLNWKLTLVALLVGPPAVLITRGFSKRLRAMSRAEQTAMGDLNHALEESIGCHRVVKVFGGQDYEAKRFDAGANKVRTFNMKMTSAAAANVPLVQIVVSVALALIIYLAVRQAATDETTVGGFVSFLTALLLVFQPLRRLTGVNQTLQRGLAAAESVFHLIDERPESDTGTREIGRAKGKVEFRGAHARPWIVFRFPSNRVRPLRWSGPPAPASPRSPTCCRASTPPIPGKSCSTASTSRRSGSRACARTSRW